MDFSTQSSGICTFCFIIQFLQCPFQRRFFSFLSVFDYCWAGATVTGCAPQDQIWVLQHKRVGPAPQSLQTCIWQHSGSTDLAQTANKSQPSQLHSFKSHYCSHSWLNSSASISNEKKRSPGCIEQLPDISCTLRACQYYCKAFEYSTPEMVMGFFFPIGWTLSD